MIKTIQIVALLQGLFVIYVLFINRKDYKKTTFWLLFGSLLSVLLYIIGDDEYNLIVKDADWILFDSSLFVTFLFLFFKYFKNEKQNFLKRDYIFFLPNLVYFIIEGIEIIILEEHFLIEIFEVLVELTFVVYLLLIVYSVITTKKKHWVIYFAIPIVILFALSSLNDVLEVLGQPEIKFFNEENFNTYLLLIIAFLFYYLAFKLLSNENYNQVLPKKEINKYKNSNLNPKLIDKYKGELIKAMTVDKLYLNSKLSIHDVSKKVDIPRQYISEVLNLHMKTSFQDFINEYRVEEFIKCLQNEAFKNYTLLAIANEVGFSSKSSFNTTFKKLKGMTPSQYKKQLV